MNDKEKVHPFDYFAFEENGKVWWFEFSTLFAWMLRSANPVNPYTKVPLSLHTRKRVFACWVYRVNRRGALVDAPNLQDRTEQCATYLAQIFADNGFVDVHPHTFAEVPRASWIRFFRVLQSELMVAYSEENRLRRRGIMMCRRMENFIPGLTPAQYIAASLQTLLHALSVPRDPYLLCFSILSCFHRI